MRKEILVSFPDGARPQHSPAQMCRLSLLHLSQMTFLSGFPGPYLRGGFLLPLETSSLGSALLGNLLISGVKAVCPLWSLITTSLERRAAALANHNEALGVELSGKRGWQQLQGLCTPLPIPDDFLLSSGLTSWTGASRSFQREQYPITHLLLGKSMGFHRPMSRCPPLRIPSDFFGKIPDAWLLQ